MQDITTNMLLSLGVKGSIYIVFKIY